MKFNNDILNELETLSPLLANSSRKNIFFVPPAYFDSLCDTILMCVLEVQDTVLPEMGPDIPEGYFENLSHSILHKIKMQGQNNKEDETLPLFLQDNRSINPFAVPQGYFDSLSINVIQKINNGLPEEENILPLIMQNIQNNNPYHLPQEGYFNSLSSLILQKINDGEKDVSNVEETLPAILEGLHTVNVFNVPLLYFDNLPASILDRVNNQDMNAIDELTVLSPMLSAIQKNNVFETPDGYFDGIVPGVLQNAKPAKSRVVPMFGASSVFKYAAAAIVTGAMAFGIYQFANKQDAANTTAVAKMDPVIEKGKSMDEVQFNNTLNNLSGDDISKYLEKNIKEEDMALLSADLEEKELPEKYDYLLDEKTLDNYLDKIEVQN